MFANESESYPFTKSFGTAPLLKAEILVFIFPVSLKQLMSVTTALKTPNNWSAIF